MKTLEEILEDVLAAEGGYSNNPSDAGGETNYGITVLVARANGYHGDMRYLPRELAKQIYTIQYWLTPKLDQVNNLSSSVAVEMFDTGVNAGVSFAVKALQDALNILNRNGADYKDVVVDGNIGPATLLALGQYLAKRGKDGENVLVKVLNIIQGAHYISITKSRPANEAFLTGWIKNRVVM